MEDKKIPVSAIVQVWPTRVKITKEEIIKRLFADLSPGAVIEIGGVQFIYSKDGDL